MEGMVSKRLRELQTTYTVVTGSRVMPEQWTTGVVIKLLEVTHGQWLYCCIQVHDRVQETQATQHKEELSKKLRLNWILVLMAGLRRFNIWRRWIWRIWRILPGENRNTGQPQCASHGRSFNFGVLLNQIRVAIGPQEMCNLLHIF